MKFTGGAGVYGIALVRLLFAYIEISAGELLVAVLINLLYQACCTLTHFLQSFQTLS